jgi:hypothetical protein
MRLAPIILMDQIQTKQIPGLVGFAAMGNQLL